MMFEGGLHAGCTGFERSWEMPHYVCHVIEETRRLGSCLEFCSFHHVRREGNKLTHSLARRAILSADIDVWVEELPEDLDDVFQGNFTL